jgi:tetratricopeptide (TPR) repeat protein
MKPFYLSVIFFVLCAASFAEEPNAALKEAMNLEKKGDLDGAIALLKELEQQTPDDPQVAKYLGRDYVLKVDDQTDPAQKKELAQIGLEFSQKAAEALPEDAEAQLAVAAAYGKLCNFTDPKTKIEYSKIVYAKAVLGLKLNPNSDFGHLILARWNFEMSTLNPLLKGIAQFAYGQFPPASKEDSIAHFRKAIELAPQRVVHHAEFAHALDAFGDKEEAKKEWKKVIELKPVYSQDRRFQAIAETKLGSA